MFEKSKNHQYENMKKILFKNIPENMVNEHEIINLSNSDYFYLFRS